MDNGAELVSAKVLLKEVVAVGACILPYFIGASFLSNFEANPTVHSSAAGRVSSEEGNFDLLTIQIMPQISECKLDSKMGNKLATRRGSGFESSSSAPFLR